MYKPQGMQKAGNNQYKKKPFSLGTLIWHSSAKNKNVLPLTQKTSVEHAAFQRGPGQTAKS